MGCSRGVEGTGALAPIKPRAHPTCEAEAKEVLDIRGASSHPTEQTELPDNIYGLFREVQDLAATLRCALDQSVEGRWRIAAVARRIEALLQEQRRVRPSEVSRHWAEGIMGAGDRGLHCRQHAFLCSQGQAAIIAPWIQSSFGGFVV